MRIRRFMAAMAIGLACSFPAHAQTLPDPFAGLDAQLEALLGPRAVLGEVVTERDIDLLLAHLKAALLARSVGGEAPPPEELARRAEAIGNALKARGTLAGLLLLGAVEASVKQWMRELPAHRALPPVRPYTPILY